MEECAENGESLEVRLTGIERARVRPGKDLWERYREFLPFSDPSPEFSLGEGNTPLVPASRTLREFTHCQRLFLKNETANPTWSFKDRGSIACIMMAREQGEGYTATISTGNMGHSVAAYAAHAGMTAIVLVPQYAPDEKVFAMAMHGATVVRVQAPDYSAMKAALLTMAEKLRLRLVSGNGPIRVEGYKLTAWEIIEQMQGEVPDVVAVPTSACGHIRGLFKGFRELRNAGVTAALPRMAVVQAAQNNPIVSAIRQGADHVIPVREVRTIAEAITSGDPPGGDEIVRKAARFGWPAEDVTEEEIVDGQRRLAAAGFFVEPSAATTVHAVRKMREQGSIPADASVVIVLTGSGLKDTGVLHRHHLRVVESTLSSLYDTLARLLECSRR
jgi:threonine synthase